MTDNQMLNQEQLSRKSLNLGCGQYPIAGALNIDSIPQAKADVILDLNRPGSLLELPHGHYSEITASHVMEHLDDVFSVIRDCAELLEPGGRIHIKVPHFSRGFTHSEHRHGFDVGFPHYFNPKLPAFYYGPTLELEKMRLDWAIRFDIYEMVVPRWQVAIVKVLNTILTPLANLSPGLCSRIWCFWVGGFEQIEYVFRKPRV
ncbi:MAG: methyltransferase domain-containing protein [Patescibacteria group bacterium]